jgi:aminobenzoyl-glutamate utilization protein B
MKNRRFASLLLLPLSALAADNAGILQSIDNHAAQYGEVSKQIWQFAELGYHETKSSALLQRQLKDAGFDVQAGVAEIPTAFTATFGQGKPVIGILGEFDALPGLSQDTVAERKAIANGAPGHACGHNLLGSGSALAAVAVKEYLAANKLPGTIRFYGTPAEEGGSGKVYMTRAGLFKDVDVVLTWHPGAENGVSNGGALATISAKFRFHGVASHAAVAPERGRSALDGVMMMNFAVEMLREHIPSNTRIHYIITKGGDAVNIVPETAETMLLARHPSMVVLDGIWERVLKCAQAGALATETKLDVEFVGSTYNVLGNDPLAKLMDKNLRIVGGIQYTPEEQAFAEALVKTMPPGASRELGSEREIRPISLPDPNAASASSDVGDVSWLVPTIQLRTATAVPGTPGHSWQNVACAGSSIGRKAMVNAAKAIALTAVDLYTQPEQVKLAKADFEKQREGKEYRSRIPAGKKPPLDYRGTASASSQN